MEPQCHYMNKAMKARARVFCESWTAVTNTLYYTEEPVLTDGSSRLKSIFLLRYFRYHIAPARGLRSIIHQGVEESLSMKIPTRGSTNCQ